MQGIFRKIAAAVRSEIKASDAAAVAAVALLYLIIEGMGITCPILFLTGVSCAGCGMSRAWLSLLRLDFSAAFYYHPLFWMPIPMVILLACRKRMSEKLYNILWGAILAAFLFVYAVRMLDSGNDIVVFRPWDGLFGRIISFVWDKLAF